MSQQDQCSSAANPCKNGPRPSQKTPKAEAIAFQCCFSQRRIGCRFLMARIGGFPEKLATHQLVLRRIVSENARFSALSEAIRF